MSKITSFPNQESVNRINESLGPVWSMSSSKANYPSKQGPFVFSGEGSSMATNLAELIESCQERLFISTQNLSDASIIDAIAKAVTVNGVNVYLLIDTQGFESMLSNNRCKQFIGEVLLRERKNRGLDLILSDWHLQTKAGFLLSSPLDGTIESVKNNWIMGLSKTQIDEFSIHVQHEFWSETEGREVLAPDEISNPRPIAEAPFSLRSLQNGDHVLRSYLSSDGDFSKSEIAIKSETEWHWLSVQHPLNNSVILNGEAIIVGEDANNMFYSSPISIEPGKGKFAHEGISFQLAVGKETYLAGWDRGATGDWHSILRLNAEQANAAKSLLEKLSKSPEWVGHSDITLGDAGDKIMRDGKEMKILETQTQDLGIVHLEAMPDNVEFVQSFTPSLIPPKDSLAKNCQFKWIAAPPIPSPSATEDNLHSEWKKARDGISVRLDTLDELNVVSKLPGFGRKAKELQKSIDEAKELIESTIDSKSLSDLIEQVQTLTEAVGGNVNDIKAAEREEERKKLEIEQRQQHDERVTEAKKQIKDLEPRLKKLTAELDGLNKALKKAEGVEKTKIESDIEILNPQIQQLETDIQSAKEIASSKFEFRPPAEILPTKNDGRSHLFIGDASESKLDIRVPAEGLPVHGILYSDKDTRYLALTDWTHVEQGRKDAKRLNATLCASREVLN